MKTPFKRLIAIQAAEDGSAPAEIELLQTGEWNTPWHGHFVITKENLEEYKNNAEAGVRKGLPIDLEHNSSGGAVGWLGEDGFTIKSNAAGGFSLWGSVTWTPKGQQLVKDREYRFFSPEFADEDYEDPEHAGVFLDNVLIGGGLTNRPLFKNLTAVAASDGTGKAQKSLTADNTSNIIYLSEDANTMDLQALLAKKSDELTAEEKAFVVEHKDELTDEQVTELTTAGVLEDDADDSADDDADDAADDAAGDADDDQPETPEAKEARAAAEKAGLRVVSAADYKKLEDKAAKGEQAHEALARKASEEHVASLLFNDKTNTGKLPIAAKDNLVEFYHGLNDKQKKAFDKITEQMPDMKLFSQVGDGGQSQIGTAAGEVNAAAGELMEKDKTGKLTLGAAIRNVLASDKALATRYNEERNAQREGK